MRGWLSWVGAVGLSSAVCAGCGSGGEPAEGRLGTQQGPLLVNASFDTDSSGFVYVDDVFGTSSPSAASGSVAAGRARVTLGQAPNTGANSGGWQRTFNASGPVSVSLFYALSHTDLFEAPECAEARVSIDGLSYGTGGEPYIVRICDGGSASGNFGFTSAPLAPGVHSITVGGYLNSNSFSDEISTLEFDNVVVDGIAAASCGDSSCNGGETCASCAADCGACAPACPDGACNGAETCSSCPSDCSECSATGAFIESAGQVVVEAESFMVNTAQGGHGWTPDSASSPSGGQALAATPNSGVTRDTGYTATSPRLDYRVNFTQTGTYHVWLRGRAASPASGNSSVHAGIDGAATPSADRMNGYGTSFSWRRSTSDGATASLQVTSPGVHTIHLWMRQDGFVVDKVLLRTSASGSAPSGAGPAQSPRLNVCGDTLCNGTEQCSTCPADCGACPPTCPDGACNGTETCSTCPGDCGACSVFGLDSRPSNPTCIAPPPIATGFALNRRWPSLTFAEPLGLLQAPGDNGWFYVLEKTGRMRAVPSDDGAVNGDTRVFLNLSGVVALGAAGEGGLLGAAFHPSYASNRFVLVSYTLSVGGVFTSRLSRFQSTDGGLSLDPATERVLFSHAKTKDNHNGGKIAFGPDGYLYVSLGDDAYQDFTRALLAADPNTWFGKVLRIDVSTGSTAPFYTIPSDNPFATGSGPQREVFAYGFRNPWRFSFDRLTGDLWLADVGEDTWEEIDLVQNGGFYGWPHREAEQCRPNMDCALAQRGPEHAYAHGGPLSITGGYVYRGATIPELYGHYVYGDYISGQVWAYDLSNRQNQSLDIGGGTLAAWGQDNAGELYAIRHSAGIIERLERLGGGGPSDFPALITETGCFDPSAPTSLVSGAIPYSLAVPFWSDGAEKERYLALPNGTTLAVDASGDWVLPPGGVTIKNFRHQGQLFETRFFVRHSDGSYSGYTYEWNSPPTQATLVGAGGKLRGLPGLTWTYPSRSQCFACHTDVAGGSIGLETRQLNISSFYPSTGRTANQLETLHHVGMLSGTLTSLAPLPASDDPNLPLMERAKAYLHVNCSSCHRPTGPGRGPMDARFETPFAGMRLCNEPPALGELGVPGARLLKPSDTLGSIAWLRMSQRQADFMPPLGSAQPDAAGAALLSDWIESISACPVPPTLPCGVAGNRVTNCEFASGQAPWALRRGPGGNGSSSASGGELRIDISNPGTLDWHVQAVQILGSLNAGSYQISFRARAASNRNIVVNMGEEGDDFSSFCNQSLALTPVMQTFTISCTMPAADNNVKLDFNVGNPGSASVFIDSVYFGPPR